MNSLTTRSKEAIKTGLAMAITYGIALQAGWDKPYWAGFAVAMISLSTAGQSLNKGAMRMLGTLVGLAAALTFQALFAQDRWWFMVVLDKVPEDVQLRVGTTASVLVMTGTSDNESEKPAVTAPKALQ